MRKFVIAWAAILACALGLTVMRFSGAPVKADADDRTQVVMLTNFLLTGSYGLPQQTQIQRMAVYHDYALVQLNAPLPARLTASPAPLPPTSAGGPASSTPRAGPSTPPAGPASATASSAPQAGASNTPSGPGSYVAIKAHRNWIFQFGKAGSYSQADLITAGVPKDVAAGLIQFLIAPRPLPSA